MSAWLDSQSALGERGLARSSKVLTGIAIYWGNAALSFSTRHIKEDWLSVSWYRLSIATSLRHHLSIIECTFKLVIVLMCLDCHKCL